MTSPAGAADDDDEEVQRKREMPSEDDFNTIEQILEFQDTLSGEMIDFQHQLTVVCAQRAKDWMVVASAFELQRQRAAAISESCAWIARKSADGVGDIITAKFALDDDEAYLDDDEDDDDD